VRANLIYNPQAGLIDVYQFTPQQILTTLQEAGYDPVYRPTACEDDVGPILEDVEGFVVAAGGDGTVRAVAERLVGRDVPLAIVPLGTANNVAQTLGVVGDPRDVVAGLADPHSYPFDVGCMHLPREESYFLEALGWGLFADMLATYGPEDREQRLPRALEAIIETLNSYTSRAFDLTLDGQDLSGNYIWVEVLNTPRTGPRLGLAPGADPGDGLFDLLRVRGEVQEGLLRYVTSLLSESLEELPSVDVTRGREVQFMWADFTIHVDDKVFTPTPAQEDDPVDVRVEIKPQALEFWLPQGVEKTDKLEGEGE
jgi:diacylglycerol kinase (ATP)